MNSKGIGAGCCSLVRHQTREPATPGVGVIPYVALMGTCGQKGYGFQGSFVLNGVSIS